MLTTGSNLARDAVLLLPDLAGLQLPDSAPWPDVATRWQLSRGPRRASTRWRPRGRQLTLDLGGPTRMRWRTVRVGDGRVLAVPDDPLSRDAARRFARQVPLTAKVRRSVAALGLGGSPLVVEVRAPDPRPAVLQDLLDAGERGVVLLLPNDPRRRAAFLLTDATGRLCEVVKACRSPGQDDRGVTEQAVLEELERSGVPRTPRALGRGTASGVVAWSAETAVDGTAADEALVGDAPRARRFVEELVGWCTSLAVATAGAACWQDAGRHEELLPLRGDRRRPTAPAVDAPGVLAHRDLGSGLNVLVTDTSWSVIDWEMARHGCPPLLDLLPLATAAIAWGRGVTSLEGVAAVTLDVCAGDDRDSPWFLGLVREHLGALGVDLRSAGALAELSWAYLASMPEVFCERVRAQGDSYDPWPTAADVIHRTWPRRAGLGDDWAALRR